MLKFLRKYNKWILVVGGVLLMIAFTAPQLVQRFGSNADTVVVALVDGEKVRNAELRRAARDIQLLDQFAPGLIRMVFGIENKDSTHWLLLTREARQAGFIQDGASGADWVPELAQIEAFWRLPPELRSSAAQIFANPQFQQMLGVQSPQMIQAAMDQYLAMDGGNTDDSAAHALGRARGVYRMLVAYEQTPRLSGRRALTAATEALDGAYVDYVFLSADLIADGVPEPDEATLAAQYERFKTVRPGEGEYGVGYLDPERIKLEWLKLDTAAIQQAVVPDLVEVSKRWRQNKAAYGEDFDKARPIIESEIRRELAQKAIDDADRIVQAEILKAAKRLQADGRYKKLPEDWAAQRPQLDRIAQAVVDGIKQTHGLTIPLPEVNVRDAHWLTRAEVGSLPGLGNAQLRLGGLTTPLEQFLFSVRGLGAEGPIPLQTGLTHTSPLTDPTGNRYYVTVLDAVPESAPPPEEIRSRLITDAKRIAAFEQLKARADEFRQVAIESGLASVARTVSPAAEPTPDAETETAEPLPGQPQVQERARVARVGSSSPQLDAEAARDQILDAAEALDPTVPPEQFDVAAATVVAPVPQQLGVVVARIVALEPLTVEQFRAAQAQIVNLALAREMESTIGLDSRDRPFSLKRLTQRHRYQSMFGADDYQTPDEDDARTESASGGEA